MLALRVNSYIWKCPLNKYIDNQLSKMNIHLIDIPWNNCTLIRNDINHFTWKGFKNFCKYLNIELKKLLRVDSHLHIISDSTIDYHNYTKNYTYNGKANKFLKLYLKKFKVTIDAQCGSGFHAHPSFIDRLSKVPKNSTILFIGGWNDYSFKQIRNNFSKLSIYSCLTRETYL